MNTSNSLGAFFKHMLHKLRISRSSKPHLIFWFFFILYETAVSYSFSGHLPLLADFIVYNSLNVVFFYFHAYLAKMVIVRRQAIYLLFTLLSLGEIAVYVVLKYGIKYLFIHIGFYHHVQQEMTTSFVRDCIWRAIYFIGLSTAYTLGRFVIDYKNRLAMLELDQLLEQVNKEKMKNSLILSEITFRKAQINPHFVFNTIGFIQDQVAEVSERAGDLLITLSEVMRYALTEPSADGTVSLVSELDHIRNYIVLNQGRYEQKLCLRYEVSGQPEGLKIIPLILITLIENVFKYAELRKPEFPANIQITIFKKTLVLSISNSKCYRPHAHSMGLGLSNVRERLNTHYPGQHEIVIADGDIYHLNLTLNLT